ncbi:MAG: DUF1801 domain-containing protein [Candidatus Eremiobacteraeota bacterium]|nr:DUF1801 domain-containing protein [Candidatus Eremiobacteraeota bacterium]
MAKPQFSSVDEYLAAQPAETRRTLQEVRRAIRKAVPDAQEEISYQIPTYRLPRGGVLYFAGWKQHYSIYPASAALVKRFQEELTPYEVEKGTIRFPLSRPVPVELIEGIARFRATEG